MAARMLAGCHPWLMSAAVGAAPFPAMTRHPIGMATMRGGAPADAFRVVSGMPERIRCQRRQGPHTRATAQYSLPSCPVGWTIPARRRQLWDRSRPATI